MKLNFSLRVCQVCSNVAKSFRVEISFDCDVEFIMNYYCNDLIS